MYVTKYENFVDFGDIYLSFIFNLLGNSLQLRKKTKDMITASDRHNDVLFFGALGSTMRMTIDFNSYKTVGMAQEQFIKDAATAFAGFRGVPSKQERLESRKLTASHRQARRPTVKTGEGYSWGAYDYIQAPFAFIIGALQALPNKSSGYFCSLYTSSARQYIIEGRDYMNSNQTLDGLTSLHDGFSFIDQMGPYCFYAFQNDLSAAKFTYLFANPIEILINIAYNLGYMFTDVINYLFYTPETVP